MAKLMKFTFVIIHFISLYFAITKVHGNLFFIHINLSYVLHTYYFTSFK